MLLKLALLCLLVTGCGPRSKYEHQELRRLAASTRPGDDISGLLAFEASLPQDAAGPLERSRLLIAARMSSLGFTPDKLAPLLGAALANPAATLQKLDTDNLPLPSLRGLSAEVRRGRGDQPAADLPPDFNLLTAAAQLLAGLALTKKGDPSGPGEAVSALEFMAAAEGALPAPLVAGASACLAQLNQDPASRTTAIAKLLGVPVTQ